jgi:hypothetical protein
VSGTERLSVEFAAAGKWDELKEALRNGAARMALDLRTQEDGNEFLIQRLHGDIVVRRLRLEFDPLVPMIASDCLGVGHTTANITLRHFNETTQYVFGNQVRSLKEVVLVLLRCLSGPVA